MKTLLQNKMYAVLTAVFSFLLLPSCTINYPPGTTFQPYQNRFQHPQQCGPQYGGGYGGPPPGYRPPPPQFGGGYGGAPQQPVFSGAYNGGGAVLGYQGSSFGPPVPVMGLR